MTKQITRQQLSAALVERHGQERQQHLYTASVGIAGLGGLGSNIAIQLTRLHRTPDPRRLRSGRDQ